MAVVDVLAKFIAKKAIKKYLKAQRPASGSGGGLGEDWRINLAFELVKWLDENLLEGKFGIGRLSEEVDLEIENGKQKEDQERKREQKRGRRRRRKQGEEEEDEEEENNFGYSRHSGEGADSQDGRKAKRSSRRHQQQPAQLMSALSNLARHPGQGREEGETFAEEASPCFSLNPRPPTRDDASPALLHELAELSLRLQNTSGRLRTLTAAAPDHDCGSFAKVQCAVYDDINAIDQAIDYLRGMLYPGGSDSRRPSREEWGGRGGAGGGGGGRSAGGGDGWNDAGARGGARIPTVVVSGPSSSSPREGSRRGGQEPLEGEEGGEEEQERSRGWGGANTNTRSKANDDGSAGAWSGNSSIIAESTEYEDQHPDQGQADWSDVYDDEEEEEEWSANGQSSRGRRNGVSSRATTCRREVPSASRGRSSRHPNESHGHRNGDDSCGTEVEVYEDQEEDPYLDRDQRRARRRKERREPRGRCRGERGEAQARQQQRRHEDQQRAYKRGAGGGRGGVRDAAPDTREYPAQEVLHRRHRGRSRRSRRVADVGDIGRSKEKGSPQDVRNDVSRLESGLWHEKRQKMHGDDDVFRISGR